MRHLQLYYRLNLHDRTVPLASILELKISDASRAKSRLQVDHAH